MLQQVLTVALPILGWWLLTGIINLAFGYRSQIEAWAESRPYVAGLLKASRALGFDPWNALSALKLFATQKLPDAQKADSPVAQVERRKADMKLLGIDPKDPPGDSRAVEAVPISKRPDVGMDAEIRRWRHPDWRLGAVALMLAACSGAQPAPGCDEHSFGTLAARCSAAAAECVAAGHDEPSCGALCDSAAAEWQKRCGQ